MRALATALLALPAVVAINCTRTTYHGCYGDTPRAVAGVLVLTADPTMTLDRCSWWCAGAGLTFSGATGHTTPKPAAGYCYCGDAIDPSSPKAPDASCDVPCPGNATQSCGGNGFSSVWETTCDGPLPSSALGPALAAGAACSQPETATWAMCNTSLGVDARAADAAARVSLWEGGLLLTARQSPAIPRLGLPAFYWGTNAIHGIDNGATCVVNSANATVCTTSWPQAVAMAATWDTTLWYAMGRTTSVEARALSNTGAWNFDGLTMWGPTINVARDPRWGRCQETGGEDPYLLGMYGGYVSLGMQNGDDDRFLLGVATLKHFLGYSLEDYDNHTWTRQTFNSVISPFDIADTYTPHFAAAIGNGGAAGIMYAVNEVNGIPGCADAYLDSLLASYGFRGYRCTDGGQIENEVVGHKWVATVEEAIKFAAAAESDIADSNAYAEHVIDAWAQGLVELSDIARLLVNTFRIRIRLGLFDPADDQIYRHYGFDNVSTPFAVAENLRAARSAPVLLTNSVGALPFTPRDGKDLVVIGANANSTSVLQGSYGSTFCPEHRTDCLPSLFRAFNDSGHARSVTYLPGCATAVECAPADIAAAAAAAAGADRVVVVLGIDQSIEAEQLDRTNITLPDAQLALWAAVRAAVGPVGSRTPVVVLLLHGGALAIEPLLDGATGADAILDIHYPGVVAASPIADMVYGLVNPSGKLPYTVPPADFVTLSNFTHMSMTEYPGRTYRYMSIAPLFRFGHGLSYTTFELAFGTPPPPATLTLNSTADTAAAVPIVVTNTGPMAGDEVVQLYFVPGALAQPPPGVPLPYAVPDRQLISFARVPVAAGASAPWTFYFDATALTLTDPTGLQHQYDGDYTLVVSRGHGVELTLPAVMVH